VNKKQVTKKNLCFSVEDLKFKADGEDRSFRGVAYSGKMIANHPWWGNLIFDVASMSYQKRVPVLMNHDMSKIVGSGSLSKENNQLIINGEFSKVTQEGKDAFELIKNEDFPMQESVFILPSEIDELKTGSTKVNGIEVNAPATIFRGGVIKEVSLTPLGADENTSTEVFSFNVKQIANIKTNGYKEKKMNKKQFEKFSALLADEGEEAAFQFACSCQKKETSEDETQFSDENKKLSDENKTLREENDALKSENDTLKSKEASDKKQMKISRTKDIFKKFGIEPAAEVLELYVNDDDKKFETNLTGLESTLKQGMKEQKTTKLTTVQQVTVDQGGSDVQRTANQFGVKPEVIEQANNIRNKAAELRKLNPKFTVAESYEEARKQLNIVE